MVLSGLSEISQSCPYCNSHITLLIDRSLTDQLYIEDCEVCCRPMTIKIIDSDTDEVTVQLFQENDTP